MKFNDIRTIETLLKEYGMTPGSSTSVSNQSSGSIINKPSKSNLNKPPKSSFNKPSTSKPSINTKDISMMKSKASELKKDFVFPDEKGNELKIISPSGNKTSLPNDNEDVVVAMDKNNKPVVFDKDAEISFPEVQEGKLKKLAKQKGKKFQIRKLKGKIKKLSKKGLKEQPEELFEINFNKKEIATAALDAPVKCGFEAETFFYSVEGRGKDVDDMSVSAIEYEYGELPDQVWEDFEEWLYTKGQDEYLDDIIDDKVQEFREDEEYLNDFIDSGDGPSSEAIEQYKKEFEENDPKEYENREEDGWEYMNWVREYVEEEYEEAYLDWLKREVREENDLDDEAKEAARSDYSVEDWIFDNYSYMSSFLEDYGYDYGSGSGDVEGVADELYDWIRKESEFKNYPEIGDYGDTNTTTAWSVETDSSIEPDEGTGAELISPVFGSTRKMLEEMRSLFDWSEQNFGTNSTTGLHITMSWQGEKKAEQNKLKMALLLGDEYLLAEFGRLRNSYTKSQYRNVLKHAEGMKRGDAKSFKQFENILTKGIDTGKFNSIHFKGDTDNESGNDLVEFRIAGGTDYNTMYEKVVKACVRYATIMKAGYEEDAFRKDYVKAVSRLLRKSQEIDPKKLKDLEVVNHEVIDSAKGIVGKKDYFDVIRMLSSSVEYLQNYEKLSQPNADKEWKQEIKDYKKGTGKDPSWMGEAEEETAQGYIMPNSMAPSKRAAGELDKAQGRFGSAITLLARDIADGNNRGPVNAKQISAFRKFAKELKLNTNTLEKVTLSSMNSIFDGSDKEKIARLQKGMNVLFKQNIIKEPDYLTPQHMDNIASKMWQFYQSDDAKDNVKLDKLADLLVKLMPANNKIDIEDVLRELSKERALNGFVAKLKGNGWNTQTTLLKNSGITTKGSAQELLKFLEPYQGYKHPTSKDHHVNIKSDDPYEEVAQMSMVQKLRHRLDHLNNLETDDADKYNKIKAQLLKVGEQLINTIGYDYEQVLQMRKEHGISISEWALVLDERDTERALEFIEKSKGDDNTYNFVTGYDDYIIRNSLSLLPKYFKGKQPGGNSEHYRTNADANKIIKRNFAAYKKFLSTIDKIFTAEGFTDLKADISNKNRLDKLNKDFEKNVRDNAKAKLNIPSHSWVYIDKEFFDTITDETYDDRGAYLDNHIDHFNKNVNNTKVYVIPSSHFSDAEDATNGLELIDTFEKNKNYYHTWRKKGYKQIVNRFNRIYGYSWKDLIDQDKFIQGDGDVYQKLKNIGIEISHKGDSRKGAPGQDDLFPEEDTKNPKSGEPLNRSSGISWENMDDEAEKKRFDAFDWEHYPAKMKDVVAKEMANNERSFKVALENILKKVLDGKVEINPEDMGKPLDKLATAAGIDPLDGGSSNGIASKTDWGNLADHLGIERGVNDQGVTLLAKAYTQFDGNHEWRPAETDEDGQNVIGLQRWAAAVREAEKYIRDNYNVSDGNYFRKNADGSDGDDVSSMYSKDDRTISTPPENEFDSDYDKARANHPSFNTMMQRGMQDYLARGQVNDLVGFLNNPSNDNVFKSRVLGTIMNRGDMENGPFASFQDALAVTRRQGNESVFAKFDKLSLSEKLHLVNQSKVLEGTRSFKGNKKKGKGFEHPNKSGKKAKYVEGALPDNSVVRILNKLLSEPMPASDIKKQMDAYFAIPDPTMLTNFRQRRAEGGDNICLRPVLRSFIKQQLDPSSQKQVNLNEGILKEDIDSYDQERLDYIINTIKNSPEFIKKIYRYIKVDPDHDGRIDPEELLSKERTKPETDHLATKEILKAFIDALMKTPGDLDDLESFLYTYGKVSYIDTKKLMSGKSSWDDWIVGSPNVSKEFIESLYINLFNFTPNVANSDRGPGELGLALLSPNIKIASVGDISVDGVEVEVKGERSTGGGRLRNSNDDFGNPNWKDFFNKYDVPEELRITNASGNSAPQKIHFLDVAKKLEEFKPGAGKEYIKVLLNGIYIYADQRLKDKLINASLNLNYAENFLEIAKIAFNNYANILKGKGFEDILMINLPHKNSLAFKASNVNDNLENFKFSSLDFGDPRNGGAIQVSMKK